jgi:hypothetical protein
MVRIENRELILVKWKEIDDNDSENRGCYIESKSLIRGVQLDQRYSMIVSKL